jgi:hypothetical protein
MWNLQEFLQYFKYNIVHLTSFIFFFLIAITYG